MARARGIKKPHPLGSVASRSGVAQLTAESGFTAADGVKISALPAAEAANDIDQIEVNQGGVSRRVTVGQIASIANASAFNALNARSDFGAVGNGIIDDTDALQAAITSSIAAGRALYIPEGVYLISAKLTATTGVTLRGDGWDSIIVAATGSNLTAMLEIGSEAAQSSGQIDKLAFDGNKANNPTGGIGINIIRGYKLNLNVVRVAYCKGDGVKFSGTGSGFENYMDQCSFYRNDGYGVNMLGGITDTHIVDCEVGYNATGGVVLATSCSVRSGTVWGGGQVNSNGIVVLGSNCRIAGTSIEGHGKIGIYVLAAAHYLAVQDCRIYANAFHATTTGLYDGCYVEAGANGGLFVGNKVHSAASSDEPYSMRYALNFAGAHGAWTISGNDMTWLVAGSPLSQKLGVIVNGILETDKTDFNWIRTNLFLTLSAAVNPSGAASWIKFPFNTESGSDVLDEFDNTALVHTFTPRSTGRYRILISMVLTPNATGQYMGLGFWVTGGSEVRRAAYTITHGTAAESCTGTIEEWLTAGTIYEVRYFHANVGTQVLNSPAYTYCRIRPAPL